jgi:hypothetical protein
LALELPGRPLNLRSPDRVGQLSSGVISDEYHDSRFVSMPVSNVTDEVWAVTLESISWKNQTHPVHQEFENAFAGFTTMDWSIGIPSEWRRHLYSSVNHT